VLHCTVLYCSRAALPYTTALRCDTQVLRTTMLSPTPHLPGSRAMVTCTTLRYARTALHCTAPHSQSCVGVWVGLDVCEACVGVGNAVPRSSMCMSSAISTPYTTTTTTSPTSTLFTTVTNSTDFHNTPLRRRERRTLTLRGQTAMTARVTTMNSRSGAQTLW
jgi:hypothetical protein